MKNLRQEKNIPQEKLARYLNVSFQAVSKWDNSSTYLDIELLPELARFLRMTVDELLGAEQIDEKKLYEKFEARVAEIYHNDDISKTLPIWKEAYHKFPNNIEVK